MSTTNNSKAPDRFKQARDRGGAYIAERARLDGTVGDSHLDPSGYWGVPIALAVSGHSAAANRMLSWIRKNAFTPDGDFGPSSAKRERFYYPYPESTEGHRWTA